jgi:hypothetical protein
LRRFSSNPNLDSDCPVPVLAARRKIARDGHAAVEKDWMGSSVDADNVCLLCSKRFPTEAGLWTHKGIEHKHGRQTELHRARVKASERRASTLLGKKSQRLLSQQDLASRRSIEAVGDKVGEAMTTETLLSSTGLRHKWHCPQAASSEEKRMILRALEMQADAVKEAMALCPGMGVEGLDILMRKINANLLTIDTAAKEQAQLHRDLSSAFVAPVRRTIGDSQCVDMPLIKMLERLFVW